MINGIKFTLGSLKTVRKTIFDTNNRHSNRKQRNFPVRQWKCTIMKIIRNEENCEK